MMEKFIAWDARISRQLRIAEKPGTLRRIAMLFAHSGDSWFWILGLGLVIWLGTDYWRWRAVALGAVILVAAVLVLSSNSACAVAAPKVSGERFTAAPTRIPFLRGMRPALF